MVNELCRSEALDDKESAVRLKRERKSKPAFAEAERYSAALHYQPDGVRRDFSSAARFSSDAGHGMGWIE